MRGGGLCAPGASCLVYSDRWFGGWGDIDELLGQRRRCWLAHGQLVMFVLSDGRRFMCPETFGVGRSPVSVGTLEHAKACRRLSTLPVPSAFRVVFVAIAKVRTCLTTAGHHVSGGPVFPPDPHAPDQPDGELITFDGTAQIFIAFYLDSLKARRLEPMVIHNVHGLGGEVERRKGVTVLWTRRPTPAQRTSLERCAFG